MRAKYSALLKTAEGKEEESEEAGAEEGDADITFIPGLKDSLSKALKEKEKEKEKEAASLSVYEQYKQKMKEKNKKAWACAAGVRRSYRFQLCSMGLLTGACSEQEMSSLFQLHRSRTFSLTEVTADEQWKAAQQRLLERVSDCNRTDD